MWFVINVKTFRKLQTGGSLFEGLLQEALQTYFQGTYWRYFKNVHYLPVLGFFPQYSLVLLQKPLKLCSKFLIYVAFHFAPPQTYI